MTKEKYEPSSSEIASAEKSMTREQSLGSQARSARATRHKETGEMYARDNPEGVEVQRIVEEALGWIIKGEAVGNAATLGTTGDRLVEGYEVIIKRTKEPLTRIKITVPAENIGSPASGYIHGENKDSIWGGGRSIAPEDAEQMIETVRDYGVTPSSLFVDGKLYQQESPSNKK